MINESGLNIIKKYESCKLKAYLCPSQIWTIGWGHTSDKYFTVTKDTIITREFADELLLHDLEEAESIIQKQIKVTLSSNQYSALVSIVYNSGSLTGTNLLSTINNGDLVKAGNLIKSFRVTSKGIKLQGLVNRRKDESNLFLKYADAGKPDYYPVDIIK